MVPTASIQRHVSPPSTIDLQKVGLIRPNSVIEQHKLHKIIVYRSPWHRAIMKTMITEENGIADMETFASISRILIGP